MKVEKFKVLLYLKKSGTDKSGKAPIMGRITVNRTMAQFGCKLSCRPDLWNARESRLDGKSREGYYYMRKTLGEFIPWQQKPIALCMRGSIWHRYGSLWRYYMK